MADPFNRHDNFQSKFNEVQEAVFELDITPTEPQSSNSGNKDKKQSSAGKYKTPDLMKQMDMLSEGKTSAEIYKKKKRKKKKKKKKPIDQQQVNTSNVTIETEPVETPTQPNETNNTSDDIPKKTDDKKPSMEEVSQSENSHIKKNEPKELPKQDNKPQQDSPNDRGEQTFGNDKKQEKPSVSPSEATKQDFGKPKSDKRVEESEQPKGKSEEKREESKEEKKDGNQNHKNNRPNNHQNSNGRKPNHQHQRSGFGQKRQNTSHSPKKHPEVKPETPVVDEKPVKPPVQEEQPKTSTVATEKEVKQATTGKNNQIKIEEYNQILFSGAVIDEIRSKLQSQGLNVSKLEIQPLAPIMVVLVKPKKTYSDLFGYHTTWMVTGYSNDGRTERLHLALVYAPALLSDDKERQLDMTEVLNEVREEERKRIPEYDFSIIISKNKDAKKTNELPEIQKVKEPFSIDGVICGVYSVGNQKLIVTNGTSPKNLIRENFEIFKNLISGDLGEDVEALGKYLRRLTRTIPDRERKILLKELFIFAGTLPMEEQLQILGILNEVNI